MPILLILQIIVSVIIIALVLLQSSSQSLGSSFGVIQSGFHTKRGPEKFVYILTIVLGTVFLLLSLANIALGS